MFQVVVHKKWKRDLKVSCCVEPRLLRWTRVLQHCLLQQYLAAQQAAVVVACAAVGVAGSAYSETARHRA